MKFSDIAQKTVDELKELLLDLRKEKMNFRFQAANRQLENTARVRECRRDIARIKTFLSQQNKKRVS